MSELTPEKVAAFLNRRTGGFGCSVCESNEWQMNVSDKECDRIEIRCGHCGHVVLFDRGFLENSVDDLTKGQTQANRIRRIFGW